MLFDSPTRRLKSTITHVSAHACSLSSVSQIFVMTYDSLTVRTNIQIEILPGQQHRNGNEKIKIQNCWKKKEKHLFTSFVKLLGSRHISLSSSYNDSTFHFFIFQSVRHGKRDQFRFVIFRHHIVTTVFVGGTTKSCKETLLLYLRPPSSIFTFA